MLPKYEVKAELPKEWFLVNEPIEGSVQAEYSFGKPVTGELEIKASRYVGQWEEYATFLKVIDGETDFELPPVGYVAGVPEAGGMGNVMLEITVREEATAYEEQTRQLLTVAESPLNIQLIPEGSVFKPGLPFGFLIITGYQRELTYRRSDGSFSAFGQSDEEGSLWLTAFVLKAFSQARDIIFIDENVLDEAMNWIRAHQNNDGSFDPVGFVHHREMLGGLKGKTALTAYITIALMEAGEKASSAKAIDYLEAELSEIDDAYTMAITAYTLELAQSDKSDDAYQMLMELAQEDEDGLHWGDGSGSVPQEPMGYSRSAEIETTAYATLALIKHGDAFNASRAAKWLVSRRNAYGGFGSTQDTVVALQALSEYSVDARADVNLTVEVKSDGINRELRITEQNFDILQVIELPVNEEFEIQVEGRGEAVAQVVKRFNIPGAEPSKEIINVSVDYDTTQVEVNDLVTVSVDLEFNPPIPMEAGMIVLDISIPTGFEAVTDSIAEAVEEEARMKRYEVAGRKVIFYVENMLPDDSISFSFQVKARYPVKAKGVSSQAYSYYKPEIRGETLSEDITVS